MKVLPMRAFTVTLSAASGLAVSFDYASSNGTATAGADYTAVSGTLNHSRWLNEWNNKRASLSR